MEQRMVTIYCLIEEFVKGVISKEEHVLSETSDSEVLFLGYLAVADFNGNYAKVHFGYLFIIREKRDIYSLVKLKLIYS